MRKSFLLLALFLSACDFGVNGLDGGNGDLGPTTPTAAIQATPDLVGFPTALDGSGSTDPNGRTLAYSWHIVAAPSGSMVGDAALSSTSAAQVTFSPDLGGDYQVQLTVAAGSDQASTTRTVTVPTVPIFFQQGDFTASSEDIAAGFLRSDGTGKKIVSCIASSDAGAKDIYGWGFNAELGLGSWDPAPGQGPTRFAFQINVASQHGLFVADESSDCATQAPTRLDETSGIYSQHGHFWPRFSPDGSRVMWVDNPESQSSSSVGTSRLVTASVDGLNLRVIRGVNGGVNLASAPPVWIDATHVAWVEDTGSGGSPKPKIFSAADQANAGDTAATLVSDCSTSLPIVNQIALLADGSLIIAGGTQKRASGGSLDLHHVTGASCTIATTLVSAPAGGMAGDFVLWPDGSRILFSATLDSGDAGVLQQDLYTIPTDGSSPPVKFAGAPGVDDLGPRFIAGGRQVVWTQGSQLGDGAVTGGGLMIANADGSHVRTLFAESSSTVVIGGSNTGLSCAWAGPFGGASVGALLLCGLLVLLARRRCA
jgi:hypothetical protein